MRVLFLAVFLVAYVSTMEETMETPYDIEPSEKELQANEEQLEVDEEELRNAEILQEEDEEEIAVEQFFTDPDSDSVDYFIPETVDDDLSIDPVLAFLDHRDSIEEAMFTIEPPIANEIMGEY